jgi:hypothetical protein
VNRFPSVERRGGSRTAPTPVGPTFPGLTKGRLSYLWVGRRPMDTHMNDAVSGARKGANQFTIPYFLFPVPYSLFPIPCSLFPVPCSPFPVPYSLPLSPDTRHLAPALLAPAHPPPES